MEGVKPLNIDRYLGRVRNRVRLVGLELEGAWTTWPKGERYEGDASVFRNASEIASIRLKFLFNVPVLRPLISISTNARYVYNITVFIIIYH